MSLSNDIGGNPAKIYIVRDDTVEEMSIFLNRIILKIDENCTRNGCPCLDGDKRHSDYYKLLLIRFKAGLIEPKNVEDSITLWKIANETV